VIADLVLQDAKAYVKNQIVDCCIAVDEGKILKIGKRPLMPKAEQTVSLNNLLTLPGLIDIHVHLRDEGKAYKEDFYTGTCAAVAGGITTVLDMPNNQPVTMSAEILRNRMALARKKIVANVGFYSEFPNNTSEIEEIVAAGAMAFKLFMGQQIGGLNLNDSSAMNEAFEITGKLGVSIAVHAEDKSVLDSKKAALEQDENDIDAFLKVHSEQAETRAIAHALEISRRTKSRVHFCHVSTAKGLKTIIEAKANGLPVTCETTPHHLLLSTSDLRKIGPICITLPPLRSEHNQVALWSAIDKGEIDVLGSDHAPHSPDEKKSNEIWDVKAGIPGLETNLPLLLTQVNRKRLSISRLIWLLAEKPAEIFDLRRRGFLKEGYFADLTVVNLKSKHRIDSSKFLSKAKFSPFDGKQVQGELAKVFVNGELVMHSGQIAADAGCGRILRRKPRL